MEAVERIGTPLGLRPTLIAAKVEKNLVTCDATQPAAEGVPGAVVAKATQAGGNGREDLLNYVLDLRLRVRDAIRDNELGEKRIRELEKKVRDLEK